GLAAALAEWVTRGAGFLDGPVGVAIEREVSRRGGALRASDFAYATATWAPPAAGEVGSRTVWTTPAPTHGPGLIDAVSTVAVGDGPAAVHRAVMTAIARQRTELGDSGTSMVSAADATGTVVVIVHSNSYPRFGSGIVVPEYDLTLANRAGRGFTPEPGHPNFPDAGRRPATTLHAWAVSDRDGVPRFAGGTPGGVNQLPWNAQALARILAGEQRPGVLVTAPLWEWLPDDDGVRIEDGFGPDDVEALTAAVSRVVTAPRWGCKSAQQVIRIPHPGEAWEAAADPRTVGLALAV
ncbi:MAG TPA: gamma-glutamyltransferase, partial [Ilumatobacteraceae bacterium]